MKFTLLATLALASSALSAPFVIYKRDDTYAPHKCVPQTSATVSASATPSATPVAYPKKVTILHTNDIHARLDQFDNKYGSDCARNATTGALTAPDRCVGGVARIKRTVDDIRANNSHTLLFDAGDQFQGTLFFTVFGGSKSAEVMNSMKYDVMTIGNHEFDRGEQYAAEFFKNLTFPVVSANTNLDQAKYLKAAGVVPYTIIKKYNLGVIGFITNTTASITNNLGIDFPDPVKPVQAVVDQLHAQGINRIICVSHNGYADDKWLASQTHGINLIVGGHSHSLLLKNLSLPGVEGAYPSRVTNLNGDDTFVVQAHRYGDYLGKIDIEWDDNDHLVSLVGDPIYLTQDLPVDKELAGKVADWTKAFNVFTSTVFGVADGDFTQTGCYNGECSLGDLVADSMLDSVKDQGVSIAITNAGGLRASIPAGKVTYSTVLTVLPFGNVLVNFDYTGAQIRHMLERAYITQTDVNSGLAPANDVMISPPQWAGIKSTHDSTRPPYQRVLTLQVKTDAGFVDLDDTKTYKMVCNDFMITGGDRIIVPGIKDFVLGNVMADVLGAYIQKLGHVAPVLEGRW
ncbi:Metallo-dependent phosphatase-like protein [Polychytrium aggregatum]|uniref:Metallo-dependent phosphatase-like protein n=1 Tax=Polychytrium aggregatum TaxID=110093 RepID=UPI0022FDB6E2|nr:Metallo-dependent phosphatase-like protein [Polychytrium aggregatum]KAI9203248.1 Metallo-dependent phosphatase-like protein [Polychytrium aggregatum]